MITINKTGVQKVSQLSKGTRLKLLLKKNMRSASWLAKMMDVSPTAVHKWMDDKNNLSYKRINQIVHIFNIDEDWFN